jgi:hypothetical protein
MNTKALLFLLWTALLFSNYSCQKSNIDTTNENSLLNSPDTLTKPSRTPYKGFSWKKLKGKHFSVWVQKSKTIQIGLSETLPGAFVESTENDEITALEMVIQVFDLPTGKIEDVLNNLRAIESWNLEEGCTFEPINYDRKGVKRYVLKPSGKGWETYNQIAKQEPVNHTCCNYGMGNSGIRYFEIHETNPNKAVFIELGQEAPLFDEQTLVVY